MGTLLEIKEHRHIRRTSVSVGWLEFPLHHTVQFPEEISEEGQGSRQEL